MKGKKGSITVFLALVFGLLFSMVLTSLEAARIQGATAYVSMLAELAGDSFLASYYYPVFEEYRLFGVHAGEEAGYFSTDVVEERLEENIIYGVDGLEGGLIGLVQPEISLEQYETLLTGNGSGFLAQVREQALLDGLSLTISEVFSEEMFTEAAVAGRIFQKQEETMAEITPAVMELLQLMELTDGILMGNSGLELDGNGRLQCAEAFVKQIVPIEPEELEGCFENQEVFEAMEEKLFRADELAAVVYSQTEETYELEEAIEELENRLEEYEESQSEWRVEIVSLNEERRAAAVAGDMEWASRCTAEIRDLRDRINTVDNLYRMVTGRRAAKIREKNRLMERISANYETLEQKLRAVQRVLDTAGEVLDRLEVKQEAARLSVEAYEIFLEGMEASLSEELLQVFEGELDTMKAYAGMTEQGYVVSEMRESGTKPDASGGSRTGRVFRGRTFTCHEGNGAGRAVYAGVYDGTSLVYLWNHYHNRKYRRKCGRCTAGASGAGNSGTGRYSGGRGVGQGTDRTGTSVCCAGRRRTAG